MAGFSYHPPQFSEDVAWLPAWLQPHQVPFFGEKIKDAQTLSQLPCRDISFHPEDNSDGPPDEQFLSREDGRYSSFHLFLSGQGHSPVGNTPSYGNVLHFRLCLSSEGVSQNSFHLHDMPQQGTPGSDRAVPGQPVPETLVVQDDTDRQYKIANGAYTQDLVPLTRISKLPQKSPSGSLTKDNRNNGKKHRDNVDAGHLQNADINDAVELSIAASEALAISELVKNGIPSEVLPAATILEAALRVKQLRNQFCVDKLEDTYAPLMDDIDETDQLSDLDEDTMADAFEDVGLTPTQIVATPDDLCGGRTSSQAFHTNSCSSLMKRGSSYTSSCVADTQMSENHYGCNVDVHNTDHKAKNVDSISVSAQKKLDDVFSVELRLKESLLESPNVQQKKQCGEPPSGSSTSSIENHLNACPRKSVQTTASASATTLIPIGGVMIPKGVNLDIEGVTQFHSQASILSSHWILDSGKIDAVNNVAVDRFSSRWLGGWTGKDVHATEHRGQNSSKIIPKFFVQETSFLSESVDVGSKTVASSAIPFEDLHQDINEEISFPQDVVGSSNFSYADPLCSVVPCSISLDNTHAVQVSTQKDLQEAEKCLNPTTELVELESLHRTTVSNAELLVPSVLFIRGEEHVGSKADGKCCGVASRKHLASLRSYSMVLPAREFVFSKLISKYQGTGEPSHTDILGGKYYREDYKTTDIGKPNLESTIQKVNSTDTANKVDLPAHQQKGSCSPLILNYGARHRLQACNIIVNDTEEICLERALMAQREAKLANSRNVASCGDQTNFMSLALANSSLHSNPNEKYHPKKMRVRFSEAEAKFHQSESGQRPSSRHLTRKYTKTGKKVKDSGLVSELGTREENFNCLTRCPLRDGRSMIFQGLEFLLTGYSSQKEKELEMLIWKHGGTVLPNLPSPSRNLKRKRQSGCKPHLAVVLSPKKVQTTKFLYGCAVNSFLLETNWLTDSILSGSVLAPKKYLILSNRAADRKHMRIGQPHCHTNYTHIFDRVGIMLYGKPSFCTKFAKIIKHGGGQVFKTLQWLLQSLKNGKNSMGAIVVEDEGRTSRHLRQCASENKLQMMPASWIISSLYSGKLLPFKKSDKKAPLCTTIMPEVRQYMDMS
ncbi:uncharacterized protein LOC143852988 isoform X2 [Tasmannia lanceolata]|uniref:uncharacterized protein LOC143852988 isoform X2 n=1 Tax=Tasmannia lanceolata TaxID=3420 RepID=UPI004063379F